MYNAEKQTIKGMKFGWDHQAVLRGEATNEATLKQDSDTLQAGRTREALSEVLLLKAAFY